MLQSMLMNEEESERWYDALKEYAKGQSPAMKREIRSKPSVPPEPLPWESGGGRAMDEGSAQ